VGYNQVNEFSGRPSAFIQDLGERSFHDPGFQSLPHLHFGPLSVLSVVLTKASKSRFRCSTLPICRTQIRQKMIDVFGNLNQITFKGSYFASSESHFSKLAFMMLVWLVKLSLLDYHLVDPAQMISTCQSLPSSRYPRLSERQDYADSI